VKVGGGFDGQSILALQLPGFLLFAAFRDEAVSSGGTDFMDSGKEG